jgi:phage-related protein
MGFFDDLWQGIKNVGNSIGSGVSSIFSSVKEIVTGGVATVGNVASKIVDKVGDVVSKGQDVVGGIADKGLGIAGSAVTGVTSILPLLIGGIIFVIYSTSQKALTQEGSESFGRLADAGIRIKQAI